MFNCSLHLNSSRQREKRFAVTLLGLMVFGVVFGEAFLRWRSHDWAQRNQIAEAPLNGELLAQRQRGFRGPEPVLPKPANTVRIAWLGTSVLYNWLGAHGLAMPENETVAAKTQMLFEKALPGCRFDYINLAPPGGGNLHKAKERFESHVSKFDVDIVFLNAATAQEALRKPDQVLAQSHSPDTTDGLMVLGWLRRLGDRLIYSQKVPSGLVPEAHTLGRSMSQRLKTVPNFDLRYQQWLTSLPMHSVHPSLIHLGTGLALRREVRDPNSTASRPLYAWASPVDGLNISDSIDAIEGTNEEIRRVAQSRNELYLDPHSFVAPLPEHYPDGAHLSALGSTYFAQAIVQSVLAQKENDPKLSMRLRLCTNVGNHVANER
jgi:hypothetical protein